MNLGNSERTPRPIDVALLLCGKVLRVFRKEFGRHDEWSAALYRWFLHRVVFLGTTGPNGLSGPPHSDDDDIVVDSRPQDGSSPAATPLLTDAQRRLNGEVNFSAAMNATCSTTTAECLGASGVIDQSLFDVNSNKKDTFTRWSALALEVLVEFLQECAKQGGDDLSQRAKFILLAVLQTDGHAPVDLSVLSDLFSLDLDQAQAESVLSVGNATLSFHVWVNVSWACASFSHQTRLAKMTSHWCRELVDMTISAAPEGFSSRRRERSRQLDEGLTDCGVPLRHTYMYLRDIFEGHLSADRTTMGLLFPSQHSQQLADNYIVKLLAAHGSSTAPESRSALLSKSAQPILYHITSGMLLYTQLYLTLRSLGAARQCAHAAVLVGHQLHSNRILTLAHYSSFLVHMSSGRAMEAADSISVAIQLSASTSHHDVSSTAETDSIHHGNLCYSGASELLLFFPGAVSSSLRSALTTAHPSRIRRGGTSASEGDQDAEGGEGEDAHREGGAGGGTGVVVQTVAQTVRHALWLSEMEHFFSHTTGHTWHAVVASLSRETLHIVGTLYGISVYPRALTKETVGKLLQTMEEGITVNSHSDEQRAGPVFITQMLRHTAHRMLALQDGRMSPTCAGGGEGPIQVCHHLLSAVKHHYGSAGIRVAQQNFFFMTTLRFVAMCWLLRNGFVASAFEGLTDLVSRLYYASGISNAADAAGAAEGQSDTRKHQHAEQHISHVLEEAGSAAEFFWPPDHLLLLAQMQLVRCEAAVFLGYLDTVGAVANSLHAISSYCSFPYGVLVSKHIECLSLQASLNPSDMLSKADSIVTSSEKIGLTSLIPLARLRRASALASCSRWTEALSQLSDPHLSANPRFNAWSLVMRLSTGCEVLVEKFSNDSSTAMHALEVFVRHAVTAAEQHGYLGQFSSIHGRFLDRGESIGVSLRELLSVHVSIVRCTEWFAASTTASSHLSGGGSPDTAIEELVGLLSKRQTLRCGFEVAAMKLSPLQLCASLLSGDIIGN